MGLTPPAAVHGVLPLIVPFDAEIGTAGEKFDWELLKEFHKGIVLS